MSLRVPMFPQQSLEGDIADLRKAKNALAEQELENRKKELENKYLPLTTAIKAQNAMAYGSRTGNIGMFLRGISEMPVDERQAYLADPTNRTNYMSMLEAFRTGINSPTGGGNILSPEFLSQFGFGAQNSQRVPQNSLPQQQPVNDVVNASQQFPPMQQAIPKIQAPMMPNSASQMSNVQDMNEERSPILYNGGNKNGQYAKLMEQSQQKNPQPQPEKTPTPSDEMSPYAPINVELTPEQRSNMTAQLRTNNKGIGTVLKNRADNSIAFEGFLQRAQPYLSKAFADASQYQQIYGRAKNWTEKFKRDQPKEYQNYIFYKNTASGLLGNGVRFLEAMGVSHEAQKDARRIIGEVDNLDISPETSMRVFNKTVKSLYDVSNSNIAAAEPAYPGVRRPLAGVKEIKGDYIPESLIKALPKGFIRVKSPANIEGIMPEKQYKAAFDAGYRKID